MKIIDTLSVFRDFALLYRQRKRMILSDKTRSVTPNRVNLHYWRKNKGQGQEDNLGDYLSVVVVDYLKKYFNLEDTKKLNKTKHLYAIGSILQAGYHDATVWGSGFLDNPIRGRLAYVTHGTLSRKLDVRAVRGPLTRKVLQELGHSCPETYGDPAILMPLIYMPRNEEKDLDYVVVSHFSDPARYENGLSVLTTDYQSFIDRICRAKRVISSSLHGIILAEAYGIPAVLLLPQTARENLTLFKYRDYYYGTGRMTFPVTHTIQEALSAEPCPVPNLKRLQENLIKAFPADLWE